MPNAIVCCLLLSFPIIVCHPILRAIVVRCCRLPPLPSLSAAAIFHRRSHHCHSAVSAVTCRLLLSFPVVVRCPILRAIVICHGNCLPGLLSAVAAVVCCHRLPPLQPLLPLCCLRHLSPPTLVLPCRSPPPNLVCPHCLPPSLSTTIVNHHCRRRPPLPSSATAAIITTPPSPLCLLPLPMSLVCGSALLPPLSPLIRWCPDSCLQPLSSPSPISLRSLLLNSACPPFYL